MLAKLTVFVFALVCLIIGTLLILLPWVNIGYGDWGDNQLISMTVSATGQTTFQEIFSSGWVRGAVTGLGVFNIVIAFWEIANFNKSAKMLEGGD